MTKNGRRGLGWGGFRRKRDPGERGLLFPLPPSPLRRAVRETKRSAARHGTPRLASLAKGWSVPSSVHLLGRIFATIHSPSPLSPHMPGDDGGGNLLGRPSAVAEVPPVPASSMARVGKRKRREPTWFDFASSGNVTELRRLLLLGANLECTDSYGRTALDVAVRAGKQDAVLFLVGSGARMRGKHVCIAARNGRTQTLLFLLHSGAQNGALDAGNGMHTLKSPIDEAKDACKTTAYRHLCFVNEVQRVARGPPGEEAPPSDTILAHSCPNSRSHGAYVLNARIFGPKHDASPLMVAIERMEDGTVEELLARKANASRMWADVEEGGKECDLLHLILDAASRRIVHGDDTEETRRRVEERAVSITRRLLRAGANPDSPPSLLLPRSTAVMKAVMYRFHTLAAVLSRSGASIDRPDPNMDDQTVRQLVSDPCHPSLLPDQRVPSSAAQAVLKGARLHSNMAKWRKAAMVVMVAGEAARVRAATRAYRPPTAGEEETPPVGYAHASQEWTDTLPFLMAPSSQCH